MKGIDNTAGNDSKDTILVVDDNKNNLDLMLVTLSEENYRLLAATSGERALKIASKVKPDLILMDIQMPGLDGYETTKKLKSDEDLKHVPVLFLSALNDLENIVKCFSTGGVDYISKPFKKEELLARVETHLSIKHLQSQIIADRNKMSYILNNILPPAIVEKLKRGVKPEPELVDNAVVLFTDFSGFAILAQELGPTGSIENLNTIFSAFDSISMHFGLERVKTIGDSYMAVGSVNNQLNNPALSGILAGLKMQDFLKVYNDHNDTDKWKLRIGVHSGPVMAGIIGLQKIAFDVWGSTVNLASRLETSALLEGVSTTENDLPQIDGQISYESRGIQHLHNLGDQEVFQCTGLDAGVDEDIHKLYDRLKPEELLEQKRPYYNLLDEIADIT